ncbi:MAG: hypothetical protein R2711_00725 [Acidimicrobiales bacterium]
MSRSPSTPANFATAREDDGRLAWESGDAAFMTNYSFVWPSANIAPEIADTMRWARFPAVDPDTPSRVSIGRFNLGVGAYGDHRTSRSARSPASWRRRARSPTPPRGGLPVTESALRRPEADRGRDRRRAHVPLRRDDQGGAGRRRRPAQTPYYNDVSLAIARTLHPTRSIDPEARHRIASATVAKALKGEGLCEPPALLARPLRAPARLDAVRSGVAVMLLVTAYPSPARSGSRSSATTSGSPTTTSSSASATTAVLSNGVWWQDLTNTLVITGASVVVELVLGFALAFVMHRRAVRPRLVRSSILVPYGIITVVAAFAWRFAFDPTTGFVQQAPRHRAVVVHRVVVELRGHHRDRGVEDHAVHVAAPAGRLHPRAPGRGRRRTSTVPRQCSG